MSQSLVTRSLPLPGSDLTDLTLRSFCAFGNFLASDLLSAGSPLDFPGI
jgi:hypothetical protein